MTTGETATKPATAPTKPATAPAAAAAPKVKAEPKPPRYSPLGTIRLLKDEKTGKQYGKVTDDKTINPKRANTKSATWFANYEDGMTIEKLAEAFVKSGGSMNANLDWDIKHKFVEYVPPKA